MTPIGNNKLASLNMYGKSTSKENKKINDIKKMQVNTTRIENSAKGQDDELLTLNKLSLLNAGARYELLSINKQLLDFDMNLKVKWTELTCCRGCRREMTIPSLDLTKTRCSRAI